MKNEKIEKNEAVSGKKLNSNRILELSIVFFLVLFSFTIGTFVGKKYSDNQHRLAQLEPLKKTPHNTHAENEPLSEKETASHNSEITDADVAKLAEEFSEATNSSEKALEPEIEVSNEKNIPQINEPSKDVQEVSARPKTVQSALSKERDVASLPPKDTSLGQYNYTVQVGSFPTENEANQMSERLIARGYKSHFVPASVNGKTTYRVHVGLFKTFSEAETYKKDLVEENKLSSAFVYKLKTNE